LEDLPIEYLVAEFAVLGLDVAVVSGLAFSMQRVRMPILHRLAEQTDPAAAPSHRGRSLRHRPLWATEINFTCQQLAKRRAIPTAPSD